jgi:DNA polymerase-3 subunit delta'
MIGHHWAVEILRLSIERGALRHAYLFTGEDQLGKRTLARRFAQAVECMRPPGPGGFCGRCRACERIEDGSYPDLHYVSAPDPGGSLGIDQIRALQSRLALAPFEGDWCVALLDRFQEATLSAQNALLKTLEEPPDRVLILVCARNEGDLLPTVTSRCEHVSLRPLPVDELRAALSDLGESEAQADLIARLSGGRPGRALEFLANPELLKVRDEQVNEHFQLLSDTRTERIRYVNAFMRGLPGGASPSAARAEAANLVSLWVSIWRDVMLRFYGQRKSICNMDRDSELGRLQGAVDIGQVEAALHAMERTLDALGKNANTRLALETLMLDLPRV